MVPNLGEKTQAADLLIGTSEQRSVRRRLHSGRPRAKFSFIDSLMAVFITRVPARTSRAYRARSAHAGMISFPLMARPSTPIKAAVAAASTTRVYNGQQQNADRRIPSGRNPGGGAQR